MTGRWRVLLALAVLANACFDPAPPDGPVQRDDAESAPLPVTYAWAGSPPLLKLEWPALPVTTASVAEAAGTVTFVVVRVDVDRVVGERVHRWQTATTGYVDREVDWEEAYAYGVLGYRAAQLVTTYATVAVTAPSDPLVAGSLWSELKFGGGIHAKVADVDGDGEPEVALWASGGLQLLEGRTGERRWKFSATYPGALAPVLGDLDGDGTLDAAVTEVDYDFEHWRLSAVSGRDGQALWQRDDDGALVPSIPTLADCDGDGSGDLLFSTIFANVAVSGRDGSELWTNSSGSLMFGLPPLVADYRGDGERGALVVDTNGAVDMFDARDGSTVWTEAVGGEWTFAAPLAADLDGDALPDVVVPRGGSFGGLFAFSGIAGTPLWDMREGGVEGDPAVADFDGDATLDFAAAVDGWELLVVSGKTGAVMWRQPLAATQELLALVAADVNGDDVPDVIAAPDRQPYVWIYDGRDGRELDRMAVYGGNAGTPTLADLDGDGFAELLLLTELAVEARKLRVPAAAIAWAGYRGFADNNAVAPPP